MRGWVRARRRVSRISPRMRCFRDGSRRCLIADESTPARGWAGARDRVRRHALPGRRHAPPGSRASVRGSAGGRRRVRQHPCAGRRDPRCGDGTPLRGWSRIRGRVGRRPIARRRDARSGSWQPMRRSSRTRGRVGRCPWVRSPSPRSGRGGSRARRPAGPIALRATDRRDGFHPVPTGGPSIVQRYLTSDSPGDWARGFHGLTPDAPSGSRSRPSRRGRSLAVPRKEK